MKKPLNQLFDEGYETFDTCYGDPSRIVNAAKAKGHTNIKIRRVKTDTPGLKMFMVLVKK